jgi:PAS domain S-box-containing protein
MNSSDHSRESEQAFHLIVESIPGLVCTMTAGGEVEFVNQQILDYTGKTIKELRDWRPLVHPDDLALVMTGWMRSIETGDAYEVEHRILRADGVYRWFHVRGLPLRDTEGHIVRWYNLVTDIDDRKRAEEKLRRSEAYLSEAQKLSHTGSFGWDVSTGDISWSSETFRIFEYDPTTKPTLELAFQRIHPDDRKLVRQVIGRAPEARANLDFEHRLLMPDGSIKQLHVLARALETASGDLEFVGAVTDVTAAKQAEEALRRSEGYLAEAQRLTHTASWAWRVEGRDALHLSEEWYRIWGFDPKEGIPSREEWLRRTHPEDRPKWQGVIDRAIREKSDYEVEFRIVLPDGTVKYIHTAGHPVLNASGDVVQFVGSSMDFSASKRAENKLRRSEECLLEAQRLSRTGSWQLDVASGVVTVSPEFHRIFGSSPDEETSNAEFWFNRIHPEDRKGAQELFERHRIQKTEYQADYRIVLSDGTIKHLHVIGHPVLNESGDVIEFVGTSIDVTEAKQVEDRIRLIINTVPGIHWSARPDGWVDFVNQQWSDYTGMTLEQALGWGWEPAILTDDRESVLSKWRVALAAAKPFETEARFRRFDGEYRWFLCRAFPLLDRTEQVLGWYGSVIDIHDRRQAEETLRESEAYLAEAQRLSHTGSWAWNPATGDIRYWSEECYRVVGFDPQSGLPRAETVFERIHPDDLPGVVEISERAKRERAEFEMNYRIVHPGSEIRDIHVVGHPVLRSCGDLVEFVGTVIDITEHKRAEEKIRQSEREFRQLLDLSPQHVTEFGPDGSPLYNNQAALDYHGLTLAEWRSSDLNRLLHPQDAERMRREHPGKFRSGVPYEFEVRLTRKDGQYRWFLFRFKPILDEQGRVTRWYAAATDIEDRKEAEQRLQNENVALREEIDRASMFEEIVGTSRPLRTVLSLISKVAPTDSNVLITGETGTGKELVARAIHRRSRRSSRAFVSVNCAAIPRDLIASELFGHEKGAFTGATQRRMGRFELAESGTIFLDEVGDLPTETQVALLRVLQEHEFERVGGNGPIRNDVRVIAATNRDLESAVASGAFRSDLYYRLNVFPIEMPPLRERREDIPTLVEYFIDRFARKAGKKFQTVNKKSLELLQSYPWPGNIRELQNVIERSVIVCETESFSVDERWLSRKPLSTEPKAKVELSEMLAAQEKEMIEAALRESGGRVSGPSGAAARLGIHRSTLDSKIESLRINKHRFNTTGPAKNS